MKNINLGGVDWIELRKKAEQEDEEIFCYLVEIDPVYDDEQSQIEKYK